MIQNQKLSLTKLGRKCMQWKDTGISENGIEECSHQHSHDPDTWSV